MQHQSIGKVYLVGAGPGDPQLITVRGLKALQTADVVVYDRLANPQLLAEIPAHAATIYVGKAPGYNAATQPEIEHILVREARQGKTVVRLKGGDPFVFGRGGEECQALAENGIPYEVVPGISSALAAPAYAGIPVTQRHVATSFTVVTGHTTGADSCAIEWDKLPQQGTLVILMGVRNLPVIAQKLMANGRSPHTPAAVIQEAATPHQQTVVATLQTIAAAAAHIQSPAVIVIGDVVALSREIAWYTPQPGARDLAAALLNQSGVGDRGSGVGDKKQDPDPRPPIPSTLEKSIWKR